MLRYVMINVLQCDGCRIYLLDSNGEWLSLHSQEKLISIAKNLGWNTLKLGYVKYFCPECSKRLDYIKMCYEKDYEYEKRLRKIRSLKEIKEKKTVKNGQLTIW